MSTSPFSSSSPARPQLGVVVVWQADGASLREWFAELARVEQYQEVEFVLVAPASLQQQLGAPGVRRLRRVDAPAGASHGALRRAGMAAASADVVALTDDRELGFPGRLLRLLHDVGGDSMDAPIRATGIPVVPVTQARSARSATEPPFDL